MKRDTLHKKQLKMMPILSQGSLTYKQRVPSKSGNSELEREDLSEENLNLYGTSRIYNILLRINNINEIEGVGKLSKKLKAYKTSHLAIYYLEATHKEVRLRKN